MPIWLAAAEMVESLWKIHQMQGVMLKKLKKQVQEVKPRQNTSLCSMWDLESRQKTQGLRLAQRADFKKDFYRFFFDTDYMDFLKRIQESGARTSRT